MSHTSEKSLPQSKLAVPSISYEGNLKELNSKRSSIKGRITKFKNLINKFTDVDSIEQVDLNMLVQRLELFKDLATLFQEVQSEIEVCDPTNMSRELDTREEMETDLSRCIAKAQLIIDKKGSKHSEFRSLNSSASGCGSCDHRSNKPIGFKLPVLQIAKFDGTPSKWLEFRDTFSALIHKNDKIDSIHKFHYLNSYLQSEASLVISNLEISAATYKEAWRLLCERYNNEKQLIANHLNSLCTIQPVPRDSPKSLRSLIDNISKNLRALKTLGEPTESWDTLIIHLVSAKLDSSTNFKWEELKSNSEKSPSLKEFFSFLNSRANILESVQCSKIERQSNQKPNYKSEKPHTKTFSVSAEPSPSSSSPVCVLCKGSHRLYDCATFLGKSVDERVSEAQNLKLCLNCLRKGHSSSQCRLGPCLKCKRRHNTLLHRDSGTQAANITEVVQKAEVDQDSEPESEPHDGEAVVMSVGTSQGVLLSTALVEVYNPISRIHITARTLLDSGSQGSIISQNLSDKLQLASQLTQLNIIGIGNQTTAYKTIKRCRIQIKSKCSAFTASLSCLVLPQITSNMPSKTIDIRHVKVPPHVKLADPTFHQSAPVDLLLGADIFWQLIESQQITLGPGQPIMHMSKLGWVLAGPLYTSSVANHLQCNHVFVEGNEKDLTNKALNEQLAKFWEIEQVPQPASQRTAEEIECENHFVETSYRNSHGRFCLKLPLVSAPDCLGDSFKSAKRQFLSLEKRLNNNSELKNSYTQFMQEYKTLGHLTESNVLIPNVCYFIPHHAVLKPTSESTKLRVVFNGSAKTTSGFSINDLQMVGPHIQDSLFNILIRFRQHAYVLSGDVEKLYRMFNIQEADQTLQMILWRDHNNDTLKSYKLSTVTYGLSSSSFLSTRCLWQLGLECPDPKIKNIIQNDFLVDDLLTGSDSQAELAYIKEAVEGALSAGCLNLRKYRSNLPSLLVDLQTHQKELIISSSSHTLGVGWDPNKDIINFPTSYSNCKENAKMTKRSILSESCRIFDPLGLLSLITIKPKMLIQQLWLAGVGWDERVPTDIGRLWQSYIDSMLHIQSLQIPRHSLCRSPIHIELHCFCDASTMAYAACIYLKSYNEQGENVVNLLCAKARVAPIKHTTIPRLELCACLLGAQLAGAVCRALRCIITRKVYWTDSSIALSWLGMRYDKLKTFVANRVSSIREITDGSEWRHVPTALNPADLGSRGVDAKNLNNLDLWWKGPAFLSQCESAWPVFNKTHCEEEIPEIKINITKCSDKLNETFINFDRFSKLNTLKRSVAYLLRFVHNCRHPLHKTKGILQPEELAASFQVLVKLSQHGSFPNELAILHAKRALNSKNPLISLSPYIDAEGILRVGGRLDNSCYAFEKRHPILLHAKHILTKLIFRHEHLRLFHAGPQLLLSSVREQIWPIAGRDLARTTSRQCVVCRRASGKTLTPLMGALPNQRVNPGFPFISTAVDFAGPFLITDRKGRGCKITKCYLCIFVCLRFKCLHLEGVSELSADSFILSLRRFIARRGKPQDMFCDNGRNFVGASREIGEFLTSKANDIGGFSTEEGIKFKFQPAYAPNFNGLVEASVKSAKFHLKRILGTTHLTFEELSTLFSQIEAILNSRPLSPLSSCPNDLSPLTPGHFLIGRPITALPSPDLSDHNSHRLDRFQRLEQLRQHFWSRWQLEYISELQQRHKWRVPVRPLQQGELVLLKEENAPPMRWRLGRIISLFPGKDGIVRVAEVKTTTGTTRRGVQYLCPLLDPVEDSTLEASSKGPEHVPAHDVADARKHLSAPNQTSSCQVSLM